MGGRWVVVRQILLGPTSLSRHVMLARMLEVDLKGEPEWMLDLVVLLGVVLLVVWLLLNARVPMF